MRRRSKRDRTRKALCRHSGSLPTHPHGRGTSSSAPCCSLTSTLIQGDTPRFSAGLKISPRAGGEHHRRHSTIRAQEMNLVEPTSFTTASRISTKLHRRTRRGISGEGERIGGSATEGAPQTKGHCVVSICSTTYSSRSSHAANPPELSPETAGRLLFVGDSKQSKCCRREISAQFVVERVREQSRQQNSEYLFIRVSSSSHYILDFGSHYSTYIPPRYKKPFLALK